MLSSGFNYDSVKTQSTGVVRVKNIDRPRGQNTFSANQKIIWETKTIPQSFTDLTNFFLKFDVQSADAARFEGIGAYSLFERITIETGNGVIVDDLRNLPMWYGLQTQLLDNPMLGYEVVTGAGGDAYLPHIGQRISTKKTFCLPFHHSLFNCEKYIPMFSKFGLRITWYTSPIGKALLSASEANATYTISNVSFNYPLYTLDDATFRSLESSTSEYKMDCNCLFHHPVAVSENSTSEVHTIPARYSSVNAIFLLIQRTDDSTDVKKVKYSTRHANNVDSVQYKLKNSNYPIQPITRVPSTNLAANTPPTTQSFSSEMFMESIGVFKALSTGYYKQAGNSFQVRNAGQNQTTKDGDLRKMTNTYERENAQMPDFSNDQETLASTTANINLGSFFSAVDFGIYQSSLQNSQIYSGANSNGHDITALITMGTANGATGSISNMLFHYYVHYSSVLVMDKSSGEFTVVN